MLLWQEQQKPQVASENIYSLLFLIYHFYLAKNIDAQKAKW